MMRRGARGPPCRCPRPEPERDRLAKGHGCTQRRTASQSRAEGTPCMSGLPETGATREPDGRGGGNTVPERTAVRKGPCRLRGSGRGGGNTELGAGQAEGAKRRGPQSAERGEAGRRYARRNGRVPARGVPKDARETASARSALPEGTAEPETGAARGAARQGAQSHEISRGGEAAGAAPPSYHQAKKSLDRVIGSMYWPSLYTRILPEATSSMSMTLPSAS